jgi:hypothetical protein
MDEKAIVLQTGNDFLVPAANLQQVLATYQWKKEFIENVLRENVDYGVTPGTGDKPSLKKPGAEKMASFFGLAPVFEDVEKVEDWMGAEHGGEPFFYYRQKCKLYRADRLIASADGSCNSFEKKYRYRWVSEYEIPAGIDKSKLRTQGGRTSEFTFAVEKAETGGKYGKPAEYWKMWQQAIEDGRAVAIKKKTAAGQMRDAWEMDTTVYAVPNRDVAEQVNTILKMSQKRALVAAVLIATNASDYFTQDLDDFVTGEIVDASVKPVNIKPVTTVDPEEIYTEACSVVYKLQDRKTGELKEVRIGDMSREQLEWVIGHAQIQKNADAAAVVMQHDFGVKPETDEQQSVPEGQLL